VSPQLELRPPRVGERLLAWSLSHADRDVVLGDLQEEFAAMSAKSGSARAVAWYWTQTLTSIGPNYVRQISGNLHRRRSEELESDRMMRGSVRKVSLGMLSVPIALWVLVWSSGQREDVSFVFAIGALSGYFGLLLFLDSFLPKRPMRVAAARRGQLFRWLWLFSAFGFFTLYPAHPRLLRDLNRFELLAAAAVLFWPKHRWPIARATDRLEP
jgi:hypothetical protein